MIKAIRVLVVDDHAVFAQGLVRLMAEFPGIVVTGVTGTAQATLDALDTEAADVVLLDQQLPDETGLDLVHRLRRRHPRTAVLMLTGAHDAALQAAAIAEGCAGALNKTVSAEEVVAAVRLAAATIDPDLGAKPAGGRFGLTPREMDVLKCIVRGLSAKETSAELHLANDTVRNYTQKVLNRLGAHSKAEAVAIATRSGLITANGSQA